MNVKILVLAVIVAGCLVVPSLCHAQDAAGVVPDSTRSERPILNSADAVQRALEIFGSFESDKKAVTIAMESAAVEKYSDSAAPFAQLPVNNKRVYRVMTQLEYDTPRDGRADRVYEILIDSTSGQLVKITSTLPSFAEKVASGKLTEWPESRRIGGVVGNTAKEEFVEFPTEAPTISFLRALDKVMGNSLGADRVWAWYVTLDLPHHGVMTVWYIETWGGWTDIPSGGGIQGERSRSTEQSGVTKKPPSGYLRAIIDKNGELLVARTG